MLRLEGVSCGYGAFQAVTGLGFEVAKGEIFALVGANGAGKTSTIMAIAGHVEVFEGRLRLGDRDITALPARERVRLGIAIAPEGRRLFPDLTVDENLTIGGYIHPVDQSRRNRDKVLDLFPRLGERLGQLAGSLSGGEQQMLAIGRALMSQPTLLLVDELSLGLMPAVIDICYRAIATLRSEGLTVVLVEQSTKRALEVADKVCVLESGRDVWQGTAAEARQDPAVIEAYLGLKQGAAT